MTKGTDDSGIKSPPSHVCSATPWTYHLNSDLFMTQVFLLQFSAADHSPPEFSREWTDDPDRYLALVANAGVILVDTASPMVVFRVKRASISSSSLSVFVPYSSCHQARYCGGQNQVFILRADRDNISKAYLLGTYLKQHLTAALIFELASMIVRYRSLHRFLIKHTALLLKLIQEYMLAWIKQQVFISTDTKHELQSAHCAVHILYLTYVHNLRHFII